MAVRLGSTSSLGIFGSWTTSGSFPFSPGARFLSPLWASLSAIRVFSLSPGDWSLPGWLPPGVGISSSRSWDVCVARVSLSTWLAWSAMNFAVGLSCWSGLTCWRTAIRRSLSGSSGRAIGLVSAFFSTRTTFFSFLLLLGLGLLDGLLARHGRGLRLLFRRRGRRRRRKLFLRLFARLAERDLERLIFPPGQVACCERQAPQLRAIVVDLGDDQPTRAQEEVRADRRADPQCEGDGDVARPHSRARRLWFRPWGRGRPVTAPPGDYKLRTESRSVEASPPRAGSDLNT